MYFYLSIYLFIYLFIYLLRFQSVRIKLIRGWKTLVIIYGVRLSLNEYIFRESNSTVSIDKLVG